MCVWIRSQQTNLFTLTDDRVSIEIIANGVIFSYRARRISYAHTHGECWQCVSFDGSICYELKVKTSQAQHEISKIKQKKEKKNRLDCATTVTRNSWSHIGSALQHTRDGLFVVSCYVCCATVAEAGGDDHHYQLVVLFFSYVLQNHFRLGNILDWPTSTTIITSSSSSNNSFCCVRVDFLFLDLFCCWALHRYIKNDCTLSNRCPTSSTERDRSLDGLTRPCGAVLSFFRITSSLLHVLTRPDEVSERRPLSFSLSLSPG